MKVCLPSPCRCLSERPEDGDEHHRADRNAIVIAEEGDRIVVLGSWIENQLCPPLLGAFEPERERDDQQGGAETAPVCEQHHNQIADEQDLRELQP